MFEERWWKYFFESLWNPESYLKLLFLLVTSPFWWPIVAAMGREVKEALAPEGGLFGTEKKRPTAARPPSIDPFLNIPLSEWRARGEDALRTSSGARSALVAVRRRRF